MENSNLKPFLWRHIEEVRTGDSERLTASINEETDDQVIVRTASVNEESSDNAIELDQYGDS